MINKEDSDILQECFWKFEWDVSSICPFFFTSMEEIVEVTRLISQERISQRTFEEIVDVSTRTSSSWFCHCDSSWESESSLEFRLRLTSRKLFQVSDLWSYATGLWLLLCRDGEFEVGWVVAGRSRKCDICSYMWSILLITCEYYFMSTHCAPHSRINAAFYFVRDVEQFQELHVFVIDVSNCMEWFSHQLTSLVGWGPFLFWCINIVLICNMMLDLFVGIRLTDPLIVIIL